MSENHLVPFFSREDTKLETSGLGSLSAIDLVHAAASSRGPSPSSVCKSVSLSPGDAVVSKHERHLIYLEKNHLEG